MVLESHELEPLVTAWNRSSAPSITDEEIDALWKQATEGPHGDTTQQFVRWFARALLSRTS
jgi:hypothetical protein